MSSSDPRPADPGPRLNFTEPAIGADELEAVVAALREGQIGGNGAISRRVQGRLAELTGATRALLTPSATTAIEISLLASGIGPGDEVLMPSFAFVSQANAILQMGATPVFCEVDPVTLNLDPADAERRVTPRTRMVMPVHYAGVPADLEGLSGVCERHGLSMVEDAAQGMGSRWRGRHLGTIGRAGVISFHFTKNIVCGEGGCLLTTDEEFARKAEIAQEKGTNRSAFLRGEVDKYTWVGRGGSYVLSDLLAALLEVQLGRMDELNGRRMALWQLYHEGLAPLEVEGRLQRTTPPADCDHNAHIYFIQAESPELQDRILQGLKSEGIHATFHFQPLHASPYARNELGLNLSLPVTERAAATLVRLPLHDGMVASDVERVVACVRRICAEG